ncbi:SprT-like domain-containing protein [Leptospira sp. WS92.C1]
MILAFETQNETISHAQALKVLENRVLEFRKNYKQKTLEKKEIRFKFYPYSNLGSSIRISAGKLEFKIHSLYLKSDPIFLEAVVDLLLYKLLKLPIPEILESQIYRFYTNHSHSKSESQKKRKRIERSESKNETLKLILKKINDLYLQIDISEIDIYWGKGKSRTRLGHYDPSHKMIVINPILSQPSIPEFVLEYIVFHELLHVYFPVKRKNGKNVIHGKEFKILERKYPDYKKANLWLKSKLYQNTNF